MSPDGHSVLAVGSQPEGESRNVTTQWRLWMPEVWVMLRPSAGYKRLMGLPAAEKWSGLRRPLFVALMIGCMFSLAASRQLTLRHIADGVFNGCLLLLGQVVAMACIRRGHEISFARVIDLFFAGFGPWLVWMLAFAAVWAFAPPLQAFVWAGLPTIPISAGLVMLWSGYIDFQFFRQVFQRTPAGAVRTLLQQRVIAWTIFTVIFGAGGAPELLKLFGK